MPDQITTNIQSTIDRIKKEIDDLENRKKEKKAELRRKEKMLKLALVDDGAGK